VSVCSLTQIEQSFSYIMVRTSYFWWDDESVCFVLDQQTLSWIFVDKHPELIVILILASYGSKKTSNMLYTSL